MGRAEREKLLAFARGEATWAEVEGITTADAARMARTGVELAQAGRLREAALVFEAMVEINPKDAGAHAVLDVFAAVQLEHHRIDAAEPQQAAEQQTSRPGTDDGDLRAQRRQPHRRRDARAAPSTKDSSLR